MLIDKANKGEGGIPINKEEITEKSDYLILNNRVRIEEDGFSTGSINISKFRNKAVITTERGILTSYFKADGMPRLALLSKETNEIYYLDIYGDIGELLGDGHCSINIGYNNGIIYFAYGAHSSNGYYGTCKIDDFFDEGMIIAEQMDIIMSYPQFYNYESKLYMVYRDDSSGNINYIEITENSKVIDFTKAMTFIEKDDEKGVYINDIAYSNNKNYIGCPFVLREESKNNLVRNDGIFLLYSKDYGKTWNSISDKDLRIPIRIDEVQKVVEIGKEENLMNQESTYVTNEGLVYITRMNNDENGIPQIYLTCYDIEKKQIQSYKISENDEDFDLLGSGTLKLPLSRAQVISSEQYTHVIYRQQESIIIASAENNFNANKLGEFRYFTIQNMSAGAWEPNMDLELWETERQICLFVQSVTQGEADRLINSHESTPIYLYYFEEIPKQR